MSEVIYIKDTHEFLTENGHVVKESDLTKAEIKELKAECSVISKLFGNSKQESTVLKG